MADIIIESAFGKTIFTWNHSNMVKANETRAEYIKSIREADKENSERLINFVRI
ncbi:hypothetical protein [Flavobacterium piscis]|uniref:Uncharacterized protein n=1 Tax=Flavobacterium piscis TaxID=1114874 RepID=A0ABU1YCF2_9FLAO|nr:hypothetical protein [Flavobacterium piscis]MDR7211925.1 hypothetical protein [Flavobacterium piscis]